jgi:hypothetical protein
MYAMKTPEGVLALGVRDVSVIFLGALSRAIIESISKNLETSISIKLSKEIEDSKRSS